jgi:hypothetical protein
MRRGDSQTHALEEPDDEPEGHRFVVDTQDAEVSLAIMVMAIL